MYNFKTKALTIIILASFADRSVRGGKSTTSTLSEILKQ